MPLRTSHTQPECSATSSAAAGGPGPTVSSPQVRGRQHDGTGGEHTKRGDTGTRSSGSRPCAGSTLVRLICERSDMDARWCQAAKSEQWGGKRKRGQ